ncbi:MAG: JAB domain-containing protein [Bacteroidales bacterium]
MSLNPASAIILAHNHPSWSLTVSEADKNITRKINEALKLFDVALLDHLIITKSQYVSIMEF